MCRVSVSDCGSPLPLSITHDFPSGRGLPHSKTFRYFESFIAVAAQDRMFTFTFTDMPGTILPAKSGAVALSKTIFTGTR